MAIGSYIELDVEQEKYYKKTLKKYQGTQSSIIATPYKFLSREQIAARKSRQWMTEISLVWKTYSPELKAIWKLYAQNIHRTGWSLYMQEYCYRKKYELAYPPDPPELHQMMGLKLSNPSGVGIVKAWRYDVVVTGQINVRFTYKKSEVAPTAGLPFRVKAEAFYFFEGQNLSEEYIFDAPAGNVDWAQVDFDFGTASRYYFELIITFELNDYQADVMIDNFVITDNIGILLDEPWHIKAGKYWIYQVKTRKMGWSFTPAIGAPYVEIVYTGS